MEAQQTQTVELTKTMHASRDEYFMQVDETCSCCDNLAAKLVGVNSSKGQRKTQHACDDCLSDWEDAPNGLYDPVVLAKRE